MFWEAVNDGHTEMAKLLMDQGADVNSSDGYDSALCRAGRSHRSNAATLKLLLDRGASVEAVPVGKGASPLVRAAHQSDDARICLLIRAGANVNVVHRGTGHCPLRELVRWASLDTISLILDCGAAINHQIVRDGTTALHVAAYDGRVGVVKLLIARGADPLILDRYGRNPLSWAREYSRIENWRKFAPGMSETIRYLEGI